MNANIVITAGGTGGHIFPALALAELARKEYDIHWLGTPNSMEAKLTDDAKLSFTAINVKGFRKKSWLLKCLAPWQIAKAFFQARGELKRLSPALVVAFGGYVTGPVGLAAYTLKIPLVLHEQNAHMGLTNRLLQKLAAHVCLAFPLAHANKKAEVIGNPIRQSLTELSTKTEVPVTRPLHLLVLGGSQGALAINALVPKTLALLKAEEKPEVLHQAGKGKEDETLMAYQNYPRSATVKAFIDDMLAAYQWADLVIARAGAMTVSEVAAVGLPAIFIPLPSAVDDHQTANARYLVDMGAAWLLPQAKASGESLATIISTANKDRAMLATMSVKAHMAAKPQATEQLWQVCRGVIREHISTHTLTEP